MVIDFLKRNASEVTMQHVYILFHVFVYTEWKVIEETSTITNNQ